RRSMERGAGERRQGSRMACRHRQDRRHPGDPLGRRYREVRARAVRAVRRPHRRARHPAIGRALRGADLIARGLARAGTRQVFALSGNHVMPIFDAALDAKLPLLHVRHEAAAVHMADAWGRLTGEVGVALVTGGPGHANAVSALYTALAAESPVVLLSGHAALVELGRGAFQEMAQAEMAAPACKAAWTVRSAQSLGEDLARAMRMAKSGRPGPVHLSLPSDLLEASYDAGLPQKEDFLPEAVVTGMPEEILAALAKAEKPLLIAGPALGSA